MDEDPFSGYGLKPVALTDQAALTAYFTSLTDPLSDYTFSQLYTWSNSLRIVWRELHGHLCVFANGTGDLTLLLPPVGDGAGDRALAAAWEIMDTYNAEHGVPERSRVEYASEELLTRFDRGSLNLQPLATDYIYDTTRMIDLAGGDLASKRQAKNRFLRNYQSRAEVYDRQRHINGCRDLLSLWKDHQDQSHAADASTSAVKRQKESLATRLALEHAAELNLKGMVVYVTAADGTESIRGFTFGEALGTNQSSIVIEKTDLEAKGLAQYIFSEFCRTEWADRPQVNVGDDWGLETLAWTKMSYRPVKLLQKYSFTRQAVVQVAVKPSAVPMTQPISQIEAKPAVAAVAVPEHTLAPAAIAASETIVRAATKADLAAAVELEQTCFDAFCLSKRQLQYLQQRQSSIFLVAEQGNRVVGQGIALLRHHKSGMSGRIYSLAVRGECRGQKIGRKLMARMVDELTYRGVSRVYLEVERANIGAIKLYEDLGFRSIGVLSDYYGSGRDGFHMMRDNEAFSSLFEVATAA